MSAVGIIIAIMVISLITVMRKAAKVNATNEPEESVPQDFDSPWDMSETAQPKDPEPFSYDNAYATREDSHYNGESVNKPFNINDISAIEEDLTIEDDDLLDDFNLKKAIVYSEILNPKYKDI